MKKYLSILIIVLTSSFSFAQSNYQDVVYLKNGSIIRGSIIENIPNQSIKIQTADKSIFVYQINEIEKITKEPPIESRAVNKSTLKQGYKGIVELGYEIGIGDYGRDRLKLNVINGYQVNQNFSLGIGTGLRYYANKNYNSNILMIPIFADFRAYLNNKDLSPFLSLGAGYSFNLFRNSDVRSGILVNPGVGVGFNISKTSDLFIALGYEMQKMDIYHDLGNVYRMEYKNSGAVNINVGISF